MSKMNFPKNMNEVGQQPWFTGGHGITTGSDGNFYGRNGEQKGHFTVLFIDPSFLPTNWESLISENVEGINWDNGQAAAVGTTFRKALKDLKTRFWPLMQTNH